MRIERATTLNKNVLFRYVIATAKKLASKIRTRAMLSKLHTSFAFFPTSESPIPLLSRVPIQGNKSKLRYKGDINNSTDLVGTIDRLEVYATMLEAAINGGIKKFEILYEACPDPKDFKVHIELLVQNGLLMKEALLAKESYDSRDENTDGYFRTTNKGFMFLELYRQLERLCPSFTMYVGN